MRYRSNRYRIPGAEAVHAAWTLIFERHARAVVPVGVRGRCFREHDPAPFRGAGFLLFRSYERNMDGSVKGTSR